MSGNKEQMLSVQDALAFRRSFAVSADANRGVVVDPRTKSDPVSIQADWAHEYSGRFANGLARLLYLRC